MLGYQSRWVAYDSPFSVLHAHVAQHMLVNCHSSSVDSSTAAVCRTPCGLPSRLLKCAACTVRCAEAHQQAPQPTSGRLLLCSSALSDFFALFAADQMWFNDTVGRLHPYSAPDRCLTLPNSNTANGQVLVVQACGATAAANQRWTASNSSMFAAPFNPQNSRLRSNVVPQQCMELLAYNTTNGAPVAMMPCNANTTSNSNQRWTFSSSNNTLQLVFNIAKCLQAGASGATGESWQAPQQPSNTAHCGRRQPQG